ncbi:MAG: zinc-binding dehydrogenase [Saprospiraceae bacterium]|nr:zinc-binding dehydrogenase [Saprospiraceae bacterium]MCF8250114.1 zinc-binding dehydrogenase [Saprospiraceae bacterium]MCF8311168.1 zinc-binding dehydrogenase [Saprospiraceae bacterium]MCF8440451.1 zinc-binding dehydrogenase [Saprospiraceae bacterium]
MNALLLDKKDTAPRLRSVKAPIAQQGQVVVKIKAASLNHRDIWIVKGLYPGIELPVIMGSDGAGLLDGKEVIIQPGNGWGEDERCQGNTYQILGLPRNGTFAEFVLVESSQIFPKPPHLSMEEAAALPLSGLTAYRVLFTRCKAQAGEKLLVTGAGGGVALFCIQFALRAGVEVYVTSGSDKKISRVKEMGVSGAANYKSENWPSILKKQAGGFDIVIDGAGGADFSSLVKLCNPGGRIGVYGGSIGAVPNFSPQPVFWKQLSILGSTMGSDNDFTEMLDFVNKHRIVPIVDSVFELEEGDKAFERLEKGHQFGKIALKIA